MAWLFIHGGRRCNDGKGQKAAEACLEEMLGNVYARSESSVPIQPGPLTLNMRDRPIRAVGDRATRVGRPNEVATHSDGRLLFADQAVAHGLSLRNLKKLLDMNYIKPHAEPIGGA